MGALKKLLVVVPAYGPMPAPTVGSLIALAGAGAEGLELRIALLLGEPLLQRARNRILADFWHSDADKLLMVDADIVFEPRDVARIASHSEDLVGGLYPKRNLEGLEWAAQTAENPVRSDERGLATVRRIGTGFMCLSRRLVRQLILSGAPEYKGQNGQPEWDFFRMQISEFGTLEGEDWSFCDRWRALGGKVWADCHCRLQHAGLAVWPLPHQVNSLKSEV